MCRACEHLGRWRFKIYKVSGTPLILKNQSFFFSSSLVSGKISPTTIIMIDWYAQCTPVWKLLQKSRITHLCSSETSYILICALKMFLHRSQSRQMRILSGTFNHCDSVIVQLVVKYAWCMGLTNPLLSQPNTCASILSSTPWRIHFPCSSFWGLCRLRGFGWHLQLDHDCLLFCGCCYLLSHVRW